MGPMNRPSEKELRSLVTLLDEEDPKSFDLVRRQILSIGEPVLPFLEEVRAGADMGLAARADAMTREVRFQRIKEDFALLARAPEFDLEAGSLLLARFAYPGVEPSVYSTWLDRVAARVFDDLPSDADAALTFQRLNSHLFQSLGFTGNETRYYDPDNSFLNRVIDTRRGIPVSLSVLYLLLGRRLRLPVFGVGAPGHFLVGFKPDVHTIFLDTFHKGRILDLNEVRRLLLRSGYEFRPEFVERCSPRDILVRMIRNLISIYEKMGSSERAEMLSTLAEVLMTGRPAK
jgi:regulator of sirC expression with transglutaminase-like and TPR domain